MMLLSFFLFFIFIKIISFFLNNNCLIIYWSVLSIKLLIFDFIIYIDYIRVVFSFTVIIIFLNVIYFSKNFYMAKSKNFKRFHILVYLFVISMLILIFRPNLFRLILG